MEFNFSKDIDGTQKSNPIQKVHFQMHTATVPLHQPLQTRCEQGAVGKMLSLQC